MQITAKQYKKIETRRRSLSKKDIERLDQGLDPIPLEEQEGEIFANWLRRSNDMACLPRPGVFLYTHIPNETRTTPGIARKLGRQGVKKGFPDYFVIVLTPERKFVGLAIELKRQKGAGSSKSNEQKRWVDYLGKIDGVESFFAYGAEEAIEIVERYIGKQ